MTPILAQKLLAFYAKVFSSRLAMAPTAGNSAKRLAPHDLVEWEKLRIMPVLEVVRVKDGRQ